MKESVSLLQLKLRFIGLFLLLFLLMGAVIEASSEISTVSYIQISLRGSKTNALVTDTEIRYGKASNYTGKSNANLNETTYVDGYYLKYNFYLDRDTEITPDKWFNLPYNEWTSANMQKQISVVYNIINPKINMPEVLFLNYPQKLITKIIYCIAGSLVLGFVIMFIAYQDLKRRGLYRKNNISVGT